MIVISLTVEGSPGWFCAEHFRCWDSPRYDAKRGANTSVTLESVPRQGIHLQSQGSLQYAKLVSHPPDYATWIRTWALNIENGRGHRNICQIVDNFDEGGYRVARVRYRIEPSRSTLWCNNILAGTIGWHRNRQAERLIRTQRHGTVRSGWWRLWPRSDNPVCYKWTF